MIEKQNKRLLSLDILRGITIAGMITVNNPGDWGNVFAPLRHAAWNGLTPTDLIFPFFMFIMGISTYLSLVKTEFKPNKQTIIKIIKRTIIMFLIGLGLTWINLCFSTFHKLAEGGLTTGERVFQAMTNFENLRTLGVMQRLALTYGATALVGVLMKHKHIPYLIISILVTYTIILLTGNGYELSSESVLSKWDNAIIGAKHLYKSAIPFDPEGLTSTIPAIAHVLIGFLCGKIVVTEKDNNKKVQKLMIVGAILAFLGYFLSYGAEINKSIWSPTYVLVTTGMGSCFLALLIWIIDIRGNKAWTKPFQVFGINPLFLYTLGWIISSFMGGIYIADGEKMTTLKGALMNNVFNPIFSFSPHMASLGFALIFVTVVWFAGYILYKKKIYIKI